jgi:CHRD domain
MTEQNNTPKRRSLAGLAILAGALLLAGCSSISDIAHGGTQGGKLTGAAEVPPNPSAASADSKIRIAPDKTVSGMVSYTGLTATAAHIHEAAAGSNGPVIIPLVKQSDMSFAVPPNAVLTDAQYNDYLAGKLYVNIHSATYPGGEIRFQLHPK